MFVVSSTQYIEFIYYRPIFHVKSLWIPYCKEYLEKYYKRPNEDLVKLIKLYKWPLLEFENTKRSQSYEECFRKVRKIENNSQKFDKILEN